FLCAWKRRGNYLRAKTPVQTCEHRLSACHPIHGKLDIMVPGRVLADAQWGRCAGPFQDGPVGYLSQTWVWYRLTARTNMRPVLPPQGTVSIEKGTPVVRRGRKARELTTVLERKAS